MTKVEYDTARMRNAIQRVVDAQHELEGKRSDVHSLSRILRPGDAPETIAFHEKLTGTTVPHVITRHGNMMKLLDDTLAGLAAIDREYNNGELASEFGLKQMHQQ